MLLANRLMCPFVTFVCHYAKNHSKNNSPVVGLRDEGARGSPKAEQEEGGHGIGRCSIGLDEAMGADV